MSESYEQMLAALRDGSGFVHLDVQAPRDAPRKQCVAYLWDHAEVEPRRMRPPISSVPITAEQARELLDAGAEWKGPSHLKAEVVAGA
jgi:hypothetical protein